MGRNDRGINSLDTAETANPDTIGWPRRARSVVGRQARMIGHIALCVADPIALCAADLTGFCVTSTSLFVQKSTTTSAVANSQSRVLQPKSGGGGQGLCNSVAVALVVVD